MSRRCKGLRSCVDNIWENEELKESERAKSISNLLVDDVVVLHLVAIVLVLVAIVLVLVAVVPYSSCCSSSSFFFSFMFFFFLF